MTEAHVRDLLALAPERWTALLEPRAQFVFITGAGLDALVALHRQLERARDGSIDAALVPRELQPVTAAIDKIVAVKAIASSVPAMKPRPAGRSKPPPFAATAQPATKGPVSSTKATTQSSTSNFDHNDGFMVLTSLGDTWEGLTRLEGTQQQSRRRLAQAEGKDANTRMAHVFDAVCQCMHASSGAAAVLQIAASTSLMQRVVLARELGLLDALVVTLLAAPAVEPASCFRAFVRDGIVTAVSQLLHQVWYPTLGTADNRIHHGRRVAAFVSTITAALASKGVPASHIVDVCMHRDGGTVLAVHPFGLRTEALLFSWVIDADTLHRGPLDVRVCLSAPRHYLPCGVMTSSLMHVVRERFEPQLPHYEDEDADEVYAPIQRQVRVHPASPVATALQPLCEYLKTGVTEIARELLREAEVDAVRGRPPPARVTCAGDARVARCHPCHAGGRGAGRGMGRACRRARCAALVAPRRPARQQRGRGCDGAAVGQVM